MKKNLLIILILFIFSSDVQLFSALRSINNDETHRKNSATTSLVILGTMQDAGQPHAGCSKTCCTDLFLNADKNKQVISLGLFDASTGKKYLFDSTPDLPRQMKYLKDFGVQSSKEVPDGIFLTHAHIGHYTGLMYLGKEAMDADNVNVFCMPRMNDFLQKNGPWSQLVSRNNIHLNEIKNEKSIQLSENLEVTPFLVPHRDEYSETIGYKIKGPNKSVIFIPDIDKWEKWDEDIVAEIKKVDYAFLDATFYSGEELNNRDISQIPHPLIVESLEKFKILSKEERSKVIFIHFNHTNPIANPNSEETKIVESGGFKVGKIYDVFEL